MSFHIAIRKQKKKKEEKDASSRVDRTIRSSIYTKAIYIYIPFFFIEYDCNPYLIFFLFFLQIDQLKLFVLSEVREKVRPSNF